MNLFDRGLERRRQKTGDEQDTYAAKPSRTVYWERRAETDLSYREHFSSMVLE